VVLYTADHDASFASLGQDRARRVVDLWADRTRELGERNDVAYVLVFENRGPQVGATIAHPHGQIYAFDVVPTTAQRELERADVSAFGSDASGERDERLVSAHGEWRAWVPWAPSWPFELLLAPSDPHPDLPSLPNHSRDDLARLLVDVLGRLDHLFAEPMPYMLWFHQRPTDGGVWQSVRVHAHIAPLYRAHGTPRFVAAGELGSEVYFNPVDPVEAAALLRQA
jgi:UDPglucose--hexose-1-phosphate uridylyltransferase